MAIGTAAGLVIARRGLGLRAEKIPHYVFSAGFSLDDEIAATSWTAWGRLAKWRKTIGGFNRHIFFTFSRLHRVNCPCEDGSTTPSEVSLASS